MISGLGFRNLPVIHMVARSLVSQMRLAVRESSVSRSFSRALVFRLLRFGFETLVEAKVQ